MNRIETPKLDLNSIPEGQRVFALQRQLALLVEQLNLALQAISPEDVVLPGGKTLADQLGISEKK